jgi:hypothetical protein
LLESGEFSGVLELSKAILEARLAQHLPDEDLYRRSVSDAILAVIDGQKTRPENLSFRVSMPKLIEGYFVCSAIAVQTDVLNSHHRLRSGSENLHQLRQISDARSLVDAIID